jgi:acid phosphatase
MNYSRRDFVRTLFVASQATLLGQMVPAHVWADDSFHPALNFLVMGDWGRMGRADQILVAKQMADTAREIGAKFVIAVGDNFYESGVASTRDPHWEHSFEKVYAADSLQVPWYVVLGNHDYNGNCDAQIDYGKTNNRWIMPARYFTKTYVVDAITVLECFYIDTTPMIHEYYQPDHENPIRKHVMAQDVPAQYAWLNQALAASKADWKIVVGHHPIYSGGVVHGDQPDLIENLLPILKEHQVQAYFCGHDHNLQHLTAGDVHLFVSGGGSEHLPTHVTLHTEFDQSASGFMAVSLRRDEMKVRVIKDSGSRIYEAALPRQVGAAT